MQRIKIINSNQGSGGNRIKEETWQHLQKLDKGFFEKKGDTYSFYTNEGLLIRATKNCNSFMAQRFITKKNELFVEYCEPGLGYSIMEENALNSKEFLFRDTGFYNTLGDSFLLKFELVDATELNIIPSIWHFQSTYKKFDSEMLNHFLYRSIFISPKHGEILFDENKELNEIILTLEGKYYRKLCTQMETLFKNNEYNSDTRWHSIYFNLKSSKLIRNSNI